MGITGKLLEFAGTEPPSAPLGMMRLSLFDWAACGIAGHRDGGFERFRQALLDAGGAGAQVIGGGRANPAAAALANGTLSHALDYDDTHFGHIGHPSVAVVPAALALAERQGLDLDSAVAAALIGVEASIHVGLWLGRAHYQVGYHQTATAGAFGAALAGARILRLDPVQARHALGLCASLASGLKAQFGTMAKPLNAGLAARAGVEAAEWAAAGVTAAEDGLAGPLGFGETHHGLADASHLAGLGQGAWQIETISHKFHACCHGLHAMLEALSDVSVDPGDVARVEVATHPRWMTVCNQPEPATGLAAKFSYRHTAAMALSGVPTGAIASFSDAWACDPGLAALRARVEVAADESLSEMQAEVRVTLRDGTALDRAHDLAAPIPMDVRAQKLRIKARGLLGEDAEARLWQASRGGDLQAFLAELSG